MTDARTLLSVHYVQIKLLRLMS